MVFETPRARLTLKVLLLMCFVGRLAVALTDHGMIWGDEIYQSLEQTHRLVFGHGTLIWEFKDGLRSWAFPASLAPSMWLGSALGAESGTALVVWAKLTTILLQVLTALGAARLGFRLGGERAGLLAALLVVVVPLQVVFGSRAQSEVVSQVLLVWAAVFLVETRTVPATRLRSAIAVGLLLGVAAFVRYQNALLVPVVAIAFMMWRDWRGFFGLAAAGLVVVLLGGLVLDQVTWGRPFHSFIVYWDFNFVKSGANHWGTSPWDYYTQGLVGGLGPLAYLWFVGLVVAVWAKGPVRVVAIMVLWFWHAHAIIPHKELRFILPILPVALTLGAVGVVRLGDRLALTSRQRVVAVGLIVALSVLHTARVTLRDIGYKDGPNFDAGQSPFGLYADINRSLSRVGVADDACGVTVLDVEPWWQGGYSYLHKDIPLYVGRSRETDRTTNYIIARQTNPGAGFTEVATLGASRVWRREGVCAPTPAGYKRPLER
jgi:hypothetical protein